MKEEVAKNSPVQGVLVADFNDLVNTVSHQVDTVKEDLEAPESERKEMAEDLKELVAEQAKNIDDTRNAELLNKVS